MSVLSHRRCRGTLLGAPLFAVIGAGALLGFEREGVDLSVVAIEFFGLSETPVLVAIPLFTFAGFLLSEGQAPARLVRLSQALLGWLPGGLAIDLARRRARCSRRSPARRASRSSRSGRCCSRR